MVEGQRQLQKLCGIICCCAYVCVCVMVVAVGVRWVTTGVMGMFLMSDLALSPFHLPPLSSIPHSRSLLNMMYCCIPPEKRYDGLIVSAGN